MLTKAEKSLIESTMESMIRAHKGGIDTRTLNRSLYRTLKSRIPSLNMFHLAGMLSWVYKAYRHRWLVRSPGHSVIV